MKKLMIAILAFAVAVTFCSCRYLEALLDMDPEEEVKETVKPYLQVVPDELTYSEGYEPVVSAYSYDALPLDGEQKLYEEMLDICYEISPEIDEETGRYPMPQIELIGFSLSEAQVRTAIKALSDDHPEVFWITGTLGYYSSDTRTVIQPYSTLSPQEVDTRVSALRAAVNAFYAAVPDGLSEYDRELTVHDYLINNVVYDEDVDTVNPESNDSDIYNVYGALVNGAAVCEGYARSFQLLMNGLGVDCVGVMGESEDQLHMWNAVKLDGEWYYTDATWDDQEETYARYIYFNVNEAFILDDHSFSPMFDTLSDDEINGESGEYSSGVMNIFLPDCTDSDRGYYYCRSPRLSDYDGEDVKSGLLRCAEEQEEFFVFYVDEGLDYQTAVSLLFVTSPQYFFQYMKAVNNTLTDYSIDTSNAGYFTHEKSRIIAVRIHYY